MTDFETHPAGTAARIAELEAALDSIETSHGLRSNGNLWRFWSKKGQEVAADNTKLRHHAEHWLQEAGKLHSQVATLTDQLTRANAASAAAYEVAGATIEMIVSDAQKEVGSIKLSKVDAAVVEMLNGIAAAIRALATPDQTAALDKLVSEAESRVWREAAKAVDALPDAKSPDVNIGVANAYAAILAASKKGGAA